MWWYWDWDSVTEAFAGSKLARKLRAHEFHEEVRRAGIAQERRAHFASLMRASGVTSNRSPSPIRTTAAQCGSPASSRAPSSVAIFTIPPRGVRPGSIDPACHHPVRHEASIAPTKAKKAKAEPVSTPKIDSAAASNTPTPQSSRDASPAPTYDSGRDSDDSCTSAQLGNEGLRWIGKGRFRQYSAADPECIKVKLGNELRGPGARQFLGPEDELGYYERRKSIETEDTNSIFRRSPSPEYVPTHVRLAQKFRTEPSTTIGPDGCIIQKGFVVSPRPSTTTSRTSTPVSDNDFAKPKPRVLEPSRRITWDERTITRINSDIQVGEARRDSKVSDMSSAEVYDDTAPPWREQQASKSDEKAGKHSKRSKSEGTLGKTEMPPVSGSIWSIESSTGPTSGINPKIMIVPASEAESAIVSEDEDSNGFDTPAKCAPVQQQVLLKPSRRSMPPPKGILKRPSQRIASPESSEDYSVSDEMADMKLDDKGTKAAGQQTRFAQQHQGPIGPKRAISSVAVKGSARKRAIRMQ